MRNLEEQLSTYATYHRDPRNIATHFFGVPMIVVGVATLLSRPTLDVGGLPASPAVVVIALSILFYALLDLRFAAVMAVLFSGAGVLAAFFAAQPTSTWLGAGLGLFVVGWAIQLVGHWYEGKKPAFIDDLVGLLVGPLFVVAETGFALGLRDGLRATIEERAGPTRVNTARGALTR